MSILSVIVWSDVAVGTTAVLGVLAIVGAAYKWILLPNLREQVVKPLHEARRELTGGKHDPSIRDQLGELSGEIEDATLELRAMALMFDGHLDWAQREVDKIRAERQQLVDEIWAELRRQRDAGDRPDSPHPPRHRGETP